ncbi:anthranilate synthase family protein [Barrientosiimonas humi]|uniref:anthranilate synthase family protein n=1 Tax=Barrientosiimonas humi TaxID=999931 RepID=UPI00370D712E
MTEQLLQRLIGSARTEPFALLHRPEATGLDQVEVLLGTTSTSRRLADVPRPDGDVHSPRHDVLVLVPHQQVTERGFVAVPDDSPLISMTIAEQGSVSTATALEMLPEEQIKLADGHFDIEDEQYAAIVDSVLTNEIGNGEGSNFVIKRSYVTTIAEYSTRTALTLFRRLLSRETGAYWTFLINTGDRALIGATPERHVNLRHGVAAMTPISGTYRYPSTGPVLAEVMDFLNDRKETDELYMVLDEELKMMARVCRGGARVVGPFLRQMTRLAHTEYLLEGRSDLDPRDILRETLLAPTITGSPLENACRVIARYEARGRGYYGGVAALIGRATDGSPTLDSAILIRTADIRTTQGSTRAEVGVGATLVRHSNPNAELAETRTKVAGVLSALGAHDRLNESPHIQEALQRRNETLSRFWMVDAEQRIRPHPALHGRRTLIVDAEDSFSSMLVHQLRSLGLVVEIARYDQVPHRLNEYDLIVMGPGPGDPRQDDHPKMAALTSTINQLLSQQIPFMAVCLSHQLLCKTLGLNLVRRDFPNQGTQRVIDFFGVPERVGFYNSYVARSAGDKLDSPAVGTVRISLDANTGEVHALRARHFSSVQFHLESVLTQNGERIVTQMLSPLADISRQGVGVRTA